MHGAGLAWFGIFAETNADGVVAESDGWMFSEAACDEIVSARETEQRSDRSRENGRAVLNALLIHKDTRICAESTR